MEIKHLAIDIEGSLSTLVYAVNEDCEIVGKVDLRIDDEAGFLHSLFVDQRYRRQGLAERLMRYAAGLSLQAGRTRVHLRTGRDNHVAQALYTKLGFEHTGRSFLSKDQIWVAMLPLKP